MTAIATKLDGSILTAAEWNQIHTNVEDTSSGHKHDGSDSRSGVAEANVTFANTGGHTHTGAAATGTKLPEASSIFADTGGHDHSATGNKGTKVPEASVTFNGSGHAHTGTTGGAAIAYANITGRAMVLMHSGTGSTAAGIAEVDTHTFGAADFAAGDSCHILLNVTGNAGADTARQLTIDGTNVLSAATGSPSIQEIRIFNDAGNANKLMYQRREIYSTGTSDIAQAQNIGTHAITGAWALALNIGKSGAGTTAYWTWSIYKLSSV